MYSQSMTKRALIIGGGIAGPVTAMALQRAGIEPVVYEAHGHGADGVGAFLTLAVNGLAALDIVGLRDVVCELGMDTPRMRLLNRRGKELAVFPIPARTVSRAELYGALRDEAVRRGGQVEYGKRLVDAELTGEGVRARFADGTAADGDLLVGADGLRSRTRTVVDPDAPRARHIGLLNTGGHPRGRPVSAGPRTAQRHSGAPRALRDIDHPG